MSVSLKKDAATPVIGSAAGQKFTITLTFKTIEMQVVGGVVAWKNGGTGEAEID